MKSIHRINVIDSHTGGEPTRIVIAGGPDLGVGSLEQRRDRFRREFDPFRSAIVNEPRGSDVLVGGLLTPPTDPTCAAGIIFFNNIGGLGMCGHGLIGLVATLHHLGRITPGRHRIETPVGIVSAELAPDGEITFENVPAYRQARNLALDVPGIGRVTGDVAWGGNWFFLVREPRFDVTMARLEELTHLTWAIRQALPAAGITGKAGAEIDHIEVFAPSPTADSRNFVLCPGRAYDRSPCGTGTSAKLACLLEDGILGEGQTWNQESVTGSIFRGSIRRVEGRLIPTLSGRAFVTGEATLLLNPADPCCWGIGRPDSDFHPA